MFRRPRPAPEPSPAPDVCKTPIGSSTPPIPYQVYGLAGDDGNYSPDVFFNGKRAMRFDSFFTRTYGDEPGVAKGVKSGTVGDIVEPTSHSPIVRINGHWAIRHRDNVTLNKGNAPGEIIFVKNTGTHKAPDGNTQSEKPAGDSRSAGDRFSDGFTKNAGETWQGLKQVGANTVEGARNLASDLWDDPGGMALKTGEGIWTGAAGAGAWAAEVATNLATDPSATLGRGVDNALATGAAIWHPYADAHTKGGLAQALGHGSFDVVKLGVEALLTKGAVTAAGKVAAAGGIAVKAADKVDDAADALEKARKAEEQEKKAESLKEADESGNDGVRVTQGQRWTQKTVNGRRVYQRDDLIEPNRQDQFGRTNRQRMERGLAPIGPDGKSINLHHVTQTEPGPLAEITQSQHQQFTRQLHMPDQVSFRNDPSLKSGFESYKRNYWKTRSQNF